MKNIERSSGTSQEKLDRKIKLANEIVALREKIEDIEEFMLLRDTEASAKIADRNRIKELELEIAEIAKEHNAL